MKRKLIYIFFIMLFALLMFSGKVDAKFSSASAEYYCGSNNLYIEICKTDASATTIVGPEEVPNGYNNYSYTYSPSVDLPKEFWVHYYLEPGYAVTATQTISQTANVEYVNYKNNSESADWYLVVDEGDRNSIEGWAKVKLKDEDIEGKGDNIIIEISSPQLDRTRRITVNFLKSTEAKNAYEQKKALEQHNTRLDTKDDVPIPSDLPTTQDICYFVINDLSRNKDNIENAKINSIDDTTKLEKWMTTLYSDTSYGLFNEDQVKYVYNMVKARFDELNGDGEGITGDHARDASTIIRDANALLRDLTLGGTYRKQGPANF